MYQTRHTVLQIDKCAVILDGTNRTMHHLTDPDIGYLLFLQRFLSLLQDLLCGKHKLICFHIGLNDTDLQFLLQEGVTVFDPFK